MNKSISALILAAGSSSRMGSPKALLEWKHKNLADFIYASLIEIGIEDVTLITGKHHHEILKSVSIPRNNICFNPQWETGMGSSIKRGVNHLMKQKANLTGILIVLVDQPLIRKSDFVNLIEQFGTGRYNIIASRYESTVGPPAIFGKDYFDMLRSLSAEKGAKSIIKNAENDMLTLDIGILGQDMDTPESYERLKKEFGQP